MSTVLPHRDLYHASERTPQGGQAAVEAAVAFTLLIAVLVGLVQLSLFVHARQVVYGAAQDGARVAAADGGTLDAGITHTRALLAAGLGGEATAVTVTGQTDGDTVHITVTGSLPLIVPWLADARLPLTARASTRKERFHVGK